jgi:hypothetical protein
MSTQVNVSLDDIALSAIKDILETPGHLFRFAAARFILEQRIDRLWDEAVAALIAIAENPQDLDRFNAAQFMLRTYKARTKTKS